MRNQHTRRFRRSIYRGAALCGLLMLSTLGCAEDRAHPFSAVCTELEISDAECDCFAEGAAEFSPEAQAWLVAALGKDTERALQLKEQVPWQELLGAGMYIVSGMQQCAEQVHDNGAPG